MGEGGGPQKTTTLHNSYLVKVATLGEGVKILKKMATWFVYGPQTDIAQNDKWYTSPWMLDRYVPMHMYYCMILLS